MYSVRPVICATQRNRMNSSYILPLLGICFAVSNVFSVKIASAVDSITETRVNDLISKQIDGIVSDRLQKLVEQKLDNIVQHRLNGLFDKRLKDAEKRLQDTAEERLRDTVEKRLNEIVEKHLHDMVEERINGIIWERLNYFLGEHSSGDIAKKQDKSADKNDDTGVTNYEEKELDENSVTKTLQMLTTDGGNTTDTDIQVRLQKIEKFIGVGYPSVQFLKPVIEVYALLYNDFTAIETQVMTSYQRFHLLERMVVLWRQTGVSGEKPPAQTGDHKPLHMSTPGLNIVKTWILYWHGNGISGTK